MNDHFQKNITNIKDKYDLDFVALAFMQTVQMDYALTWQYAVGNISDRFKRIVLQSGKGIAGHVFKSGKPVHVQNVQKQIQGKELFNYPIIISEKIISFCALPLYKDNKVQGVILVGYRMEDKMTKSLYEKILANMDDDFPNYYGKEMAKQ